MMIPAMSMRLTKRQLKLMEPNQNTINGNLKSSQNDVQDDPNDTINDNMKVEMTEPTNYEEYEDYFEPVEVKQSDDVSAVLIPTPNHSPTNTPTPPCSRWSRRP